MARRTVDLCREHKQLLEEILRKVPVKGGRRGGLKERQVTSVHSVRKARAAATKSAQQKAPGG